MTYEELLISIDLKGYKNVLPKVGKACLSNSHWFVICDNGDCHLFDRYGNEDDISKVKEIYENMIPKDIKNIVIPNSVTNIKYCAFFSCSKLASMTISDNVMRIGNYALSGCSKLTNMTIPNNVTSIGNWVFSYCSSLTDITIGNGVKSIRDKAFLGCSKLINITIDKPIKQVKEMAFYPWGIEDESIIKCN